MALLTHIFAGLPTTSLCGTVKKSWSRPSPPRCAPWARAPRESSSGRSPRRAALAIASRPRGSPPPPPPPVASGARLRLSLDPSELRRLLRRERRLLGGQGAHHLLLREHGRLGVEHRGRDRRGGAGGGREPASGNREPPPRGRRRRSGRRRSRRRRSGRRGGGRGRRRSGSRRRGGRRRRSGRGEEARRAAGAAERRASAALRRRRGGGRGGAGAPEGAAGAGRWAAAPGTVNAMSGGGGGARRWMKDGVPVGSGAVRPRRGARGGGLLLGAAGIHARARPPPLTRWRRCEVLRRVGVGWEGGEEEGVMSGSGSEAAGTGRGAGIHLDLNPLTRA